MRLGESEEYLTAQDMTQALHVNKHLCCMMDKDGSRDWRVQFYRTVFLEEENHLLKEVSFSIKKRISIFHILRRN